MSTLKRTKSIETKQVENTTTHRQIRPGKGIGLGDNGIQIHFGGNIGFSQARHQDGVARGGVGNGHVDLERE